MQVLHFIGIVLSEFQVASLIKTVYSSIWRLLIKEISVFAHRLHRQRGRDTIASRLWVKRDIVSLPPATIRRIIDRTPNNTPVDLRCRSRITAWIVTYRRARRITRMTTRRIDRGTTAPASNRRINYRTLRSNRCWPAEFVLKRLDIIVPLSQCCRRKRCRKQQK